MSGGSPGPGRLALGLRGAVMLARGDAGGLALIDGTPEGALASFRVAWFCLPGFFVLRLLGWSENGTPEAGVLTGMTAEFLGFVIAWAGFALAALPATEALQRRNRWPLLIAAWNYANVVQYALMVGLGVLPVILGLPAAVAQTVGLIALGYALWLEWFVARSALGVPGLQAAGFVLIDLALSLFTAGLVAKLSA